MVRGVRCCLLGGALALLVSTAGGAVAADAPTAAAASARESNAATPRARSAAPGQEGWRASPERRARRQERLKAWWLQAREVLFAGIDLDAEQTRGMDAIIEAQLRKRERFAQLDADLKAARRRGDAERSAALREELRLANAQLKQQHELFEEMRALLAPEQRPVFDTNRARLVAQERENRKKRSHQPGLRDEEAGSADPD